MPYLGRSHVNTSLGKLTFFAFVPGVRLQVSMPEKVHWGKSLIIGAFYGCFGIVGVVLGMAFLASLLRKMDGLLDRHTPFHILLWAAMVLADVWMGVLGNLEWWYTDLLMCSAPFFTLVALNTVRERLFGVPKPAPRRGTIATAATWPYLP